MEDDSPVHCLWELRPRANQIAKDSPAPRQPVIGYTARDAGQLDAIFSQVPSGQIAYTGARHMRQRRTVPMVRGGNARPSPFALC